jgi:hypothetical protein
MHETTIGAVITVDAATNERDERSIYEVGWLAAMAFVIGYIAIFPLYASVGPPPETGAAWLAYGTGKTAVWWAILGLSVATDFLLIPIAFALYDALRRVDRTAMRIAVALVGSFVVLDLAVTWSNFASLITLTERYAVASSDAQRAISVTAAESATAVLSSPMLGAYSILTLSAAILIVGSVMRRGEFGAATAYLGFATSLLGILSVAGGLFVPELGTLIIPASVLTTVWVLLVGLRFRRLAGR